MIGDEAAIKYARRDLATLEAAARLTPGRRTVVQAGGSLGVFALRLAENFARVLCFEPDPQIFRKLARNVPDTNVVLMQAALGCERVGVKTTRARQGRKLDVPPHDGVTHVSGPGIVPTVLLDDLGIKDLDLLVLDTEGMEMHALRGARRTIEKCRPVIMIEINENCSNYGFTEEDVRTALRIADYSFVSRTFSDEIWKPA